MDEVKHFQLKKIVGPEWTKLDSSQREQIISTILKNRMFKGTEPNRCGFVECHGLDNYCIYGIFAQEVEEKYYSYDPKSMEHIGKNYDPFIDFFFIILLDKGICLFQNRKKLPSELNMILVVDNFQDRLEHVFSEIQIPFDKLEDLTYIRKKEEFIKIFKEYQILTLEVDSLREKHIPDDFKFFNPNFEKDDIVRNYLNDDLLKHTNKTSLKSGKDKEDLGESKFAEAMLRTGEPKEMKYRESKETQTLVEKTEPKTITNQIGPTMDITMDMQDINWRIHIKGLTKEDIKEVLREIYSKIGEGEGPAYVKEKEKSKQTRLISNDQ